MRLLFTALACLFSLSLFGQNVELNTDESFNGYTLFSPINSTNTYLIDNCGYLINSWTSSYTPGLSVYLLEDGSLLRTCKVVLTDQKGDELNNIHGMAN